MKIKKINSFLVSYFFFNNSVICIFAFASMISSFLFGFTETEILKLGIFINLAGITGCLFLGKIEDDIGSQKIVIVCIIFLMLITSVLYFTYDKKVFWILSLIIGFFIGPIQAASRSVISKRLESNNQLSAFLRILHVRKCCSIPGPFFRSLVISTSSDIDGACWLYQYFALSLIFF